MEEKKITVEVGQFREKESGFLEYVGSEGFPLIRVQRSGYLKHEDIRNTVDEFLRKFYDYFRESVGGRITVYTSSSSGNTEESMFHIEVGTNDIVARFQWHEVSEKEKFVEALSQLVSPRHLRGSHSQASRVFKDQFLEELKPAVLGRGLKES